MSEEKEIHIEIEIEEEIEVSESKFKKDLDKFILTNNQKLEDYENDFA